MPFDATPELPAEARIIDIALEILGENGEQWNQGQLGNRTIGYCIKGAIKLARQRLKLKGDKTISLIGHILEADFSSRANVATTRSSSKPTTMCRSAYSLR